MFLHAAGSHAYGTQLLKQNRLRLTFTGVSITSIASNWAAKRFKKCCWNSSTNLARACREKQQPNVNQTFEV